MTIDKSMTIGEVLSKDRGCAPVFMAHGMQCLSCPMSVGESIEMASMVHGVDADAFLEQVNKFIEASEEAGL